MYGSLYPWRFGRQAIPGDPLGILLHSWEPSANRFTVRDVVVNVALYAPLGMIGYLAYRSRSRAGAVVATLLIGAALSISMELVQLFTPRNTSLRDVVTNVAGTGAGVALGMLFEEAAEGVDARLSRLARGDRSALLLFFVWIAWLLFPVFPESGVYEPIHKVIRFVNSSALDFIPLISASAAWFAAGRLLNDARVTRPWLWMAASLLFVPLQFFIVERQPTLSFFVGAVLGILLFLRFWNVSVPAVEAGAFLLVVLLRGFDPFRFDSGAAAFSWIPFRAFLLTSWEAGMLVLLEKLFFYGTAVWLFRRAGSSLTAAAMIVAAVLLAIEVVQTHIPGRTPEVTDPLLAILIAFGLRVVSRSLTGLRWRRPGFET